MNISRIASPRQFGGSLATLALAAILAACGSGASADSNTLVAAPSARAVQAVASAAPSASAAPAAAPASAAAAPSTAAAAAASSYSGARWQGLPTPGTITPHQEEANRYSIFVAGTQQAVIQLYSAAYLADGWAEASRSTASGSAFFTYVKSGRSVVIAVGPDLGTSSVIVVIDDTL